MRVAILQFSPKVGAVVDNIGRAEALLMRQEREGELANLDLLILPELAFSGYNHPSLSAIAPYLEEPGNSPSRRWAERTAKRLNCTVAVGYPEIEYGENHSAAYDPRTPATADTLAYNSLVIVDHQGHKLANYRKSFLYYADETWAKEGNGFLAKPLLIGNGSQQVKAAAGICMDINPYKFESAWTEYEFANHVRETRSQVVILSMAWLTRLGHDDLQGELAMKPDMDTVGYWIERFRPLLGANGPSNEVIVIFANRAGEEGQAPIIGDVRYAGSSSVMGMKGSSDGSTNVRIWDIMGRAQDGILVVDTSDPPLYVVARKAAEETAASKADAEAKQAMETTLENPIG